MKRDFKEPREDVWKQDKRVKPDGFVGEEDKQNDAFERYYQAQVSTFAALTLLRFSVSARASPPSQSSHGCSAVSFCKKRGGSTLQNFSCVKCWLHCAVQPSKRARHSRLCLIASTHTRIGNLPA